MAQGKGVNPHRRTNMKYAQNEALDTQGKRARLADILAQVRTPFKNGTWKLQYNSQKIAGKDLKKGAPVLSQVKEITVTLTDKSYAEMQDVDPATVKATYCRPVGKGNNLMKYCLKDATKHGTYYLRFYIPSAPSAFHTVKTIANYIDGVEVSAEMYKQVYDTWKYNSKETEAPKFYTHNINLQNVVYLMRGERVVISEK